MNRLPLYLVLPTVALVVVSLVYWQEHQQLMSQRQATQSAQDAELQRTAEARQAEVRLQQTQAEWDMLKKENTKLKSVLSATVKAFISNHIPDP